MSSASSEKMEKSKGEKMATLSAQPAIDHALSILLIFQNLMAMLSVGEILKCGLLNKDWRDKTREYIRQNRVCYARIGRKRPCKRLQAFLTTFKNSPIPYNGLSTSLECSNSYCKTYNFMHRPPLLDPSALKTQLNTFKIQHLRILPSTDFNSDNNYRPRIVSPCVIKKFLGNILENKSSVLLSITLPCPSDPVIPKLFKPHASKLQFKNLRMLEFNPGPKNPNAFLIDSLVVAAPKLKVLKGCLSSPQLNSLILKGKSGSVKQLVIIINGNGLLYTRFAQTSPKLEVLTIPHQWDWTEREVLKFIPILNLTLQSSCNSLREMNVDFSLLRIFARNFGGPFKSVKMLRVRYSLCIDKMAEYRFLKSINFPKMFSNLTTVELHLNELQDLDNEFVLREFQGYMSTYVCTSVRKLTLKCISWAMGWTTESLVVLSGVFPNVKHLDMQHAWGLRNVFRRLWCNWEEIETIQLYLVDLSVRDNLDGVFCGICEDDVDELLSSDSKLKEDIVACEGCSITNLKKLKFLRLKIHHVMVCGSWDNGTTFITGITGKLAFSKMPDLRVEILRNECEDFDENDLPIRCCFNFQNLEPFAKVLSLDSDQSWKPRFDFDDYREENLPF